MYLYYDTNYEPVSISKIKTNNKNVIEIDDNIGIKFLNGEYNISNWEIKVECGDYIFKEKETNLKTPNLKKYYQTRFIGSYKPGDTLYPKSNNNLYVTAKDDPTVLYGRLTHPIKVEIDCSLYEVLK